MHQDDPTNGDESPSAPIPDQPELVAYTLHDDPDVPLLPGPVARAWMEETAERYANRCLPLLIANQSGWLLLNPATVFLTWDGSPGVDAITIEYDGPGPRTRATSHFGHGIVTFNRPYLFRTSPGWNLWVKGPSNCPIDGLYALEGIVETDWATATFTMNWQLTRPGLRAVLPAGEPLAMVLPQRRGELEGVRPSLRALHTDEPLESAVRAWEQGREKFLRDLPVAGSEAARRKWEKDYFRGRGVDGEYAGRHQTQLRVAAFGPPSTDVP
jgi:hypothetical protein